MSAVLEKLYERAKKTQSTLVLSEAPDPRVIEAVRTAAALGLAKQLVLVGDKKTIEEKLGEYDSSVITIIDPKDSPLTAGYTQALFELRKDKGLTLEEAGKLIQKPLYFGVMMVRKRDADGMVTGAATSSPDVLRAALQVVRLKEGNTIVSNCQMLDMSNNPFLQAEAWAMADCVVNIDPSAENLAEIAVQTAKSMKELLDIEPRVAMLSFSTKGSAKHPFIDKVTEATRLVKKIAPDILVDGELQFDAAIVKEVGKTKCPDSPVAGEANVMIFPDINSGNIGYKIAERCGGAPFIGCVVQGLNRPVNDLSRGCCAGDIVNQIALTAIQAKLD